MNADTYESPEPMAEEPAEEQGTESETAMLPLSIFGQKDVKPGSECTFKVEKVYDDEVEVSYVPHKSKPPEEEGEAMSEAQGNIDRMAEEA